MYIIIPKSVTDKFIDKMARSFIEISSDSSKEWDFVRINTDWRGYEVYRTKEEFKTANLNEQLLGYGFGKKINLNVEIYLGVEKFTEIAVLHNGYYYIYLKSGIIGMLLFLSFTSNLFIKYFRISRKYQQLIEGKILIGISLWMLLATYVVAGPYNPKYAFTFCMLIGYLTILIDRKKLEAKQ